MTNTTLDAWGRVPLWWAQRIPAVNAFRVAICIAAHADRDGSAWPSIDTIALEVGLRRDRVIAALRQLEKTGILTTTRRYKQASVYTLAFSAPDVPTIGTRESRFTDVPETSTREGSDVPETGCSDVPETGCSEVPVSGSDVPASLDSNRSIEHTMNTNDDVGGTLNETKEDDGFESVVAALRRHGHDDASARSEARSVIRAGGSDRANIAAEWLNHLHGQIGVQNPIALAICKTREGARPPRSGPRYEDLSAQAAVARFNEARSETLGESMNARLGREIAEQYRRGHGTVREKTDQFLLDHGLAR